jgi:hydrogenase 3 maturation protease
LPATWKESLDLLLSPRRAESNTPRRTAVVGVGNPMRSDDAAGILVARGLSQRESAADTGRVLILEAGQAPENRTGELRKFAPELVFIIDAADLGQGPGTAQWIPEESIDGMSASTHSMPLSMLAHYLRLELKCTVLFLGVQPDSNEVGERVSPEVSRAIAEIIDGLDTFLRASGSQKAGME